MNSRTRGMVERLIESARAYGFQQRGGDAALIARNRRYLDEDHAALARCLDGEREPIASPVIRDIEARADAAMPGPWHWWGSLTGHNLHLTSLAPGRWTVMDFTRHGMQGAQPRFGVGGLMKKAEEVAIFHVCPECEDRHDRRVYRDDVIGFRNPEATFLAHSREDVDALLGYIRVLEAKIARLEGVTPALEARG